MKIVCTQENLRAGLQAVTRIISPSNTLPVLNNVLLRAEKGALTLTATNLEIAISTVVRCMVEEPGSVSLPAKTITDLVSNLSNETISLETQDNDVLVSAPNTQVKIRSLPSDDFPIIPRVENGQNFTIDAKVLAEAINEVIFAASHNETQPEISGVLLTVKKGVAKLAATDRYRLAERTLPATISLADRDIIIPQKAAAETSRILAASEVAVKVEFNDNQIVFTSQETEVVSRLIDGQYPDYEQIIPTSHTTRAELDKRALVSALKTIGIFSHGTGSVQISYDSSAGKVELSSMAHDLGEGKAELPCQIEGGAGSIYLNHRYILDALNAVTGDLLVMRIIDDSSPVVLQPAGRTDYTYLIMPIKG